MSRGKSRPTKNKKNAIRDRRPQAECSSSHGEDLASKKPNAFEKFCGPLKILVDFATIVSVLFAAFQIRQSTRQFVDSGARYTMYYVDFGQENVSDDAEWRQNVQSMVLTNTGRTTGSIVAAKYAHRKDKEVSLCMPSFDENGDYVAGSAYVTGASPISLDPSDSVLVFSIDAPVRSTTTTIKGSNGNVEVKGGGHVAFDKSIMVFGADGRDPQNIELRQDAPEPTTSHYMKLRGYPDARVACIAAANAFTKDSTRMGSD